MATVLLTNTYFLHLDPKQERKMEPYPPLATLYAAAVLRDNGHHVIFHDNVFEQNTSSIKQRIAENSGALFVIYDDGFNYLTKMCLVNMRNACFDMIRYAKEQGCTVYVSSSDATDHTEQYLQAGADVVIIGEAEITLKELIDAHTKDQKEIDDIPGIAVLRDGHVFRSIKRQVITDLDALPLPAWDLADLNAYRQRWQAHNGYFSLNMTTTRGCPFKCNWCAKPIYGNRYNSRSPQRVAEELQVLIHDHGVEHIWFCDDIFGLKPGWIAAFAQCVQEKQLLFRFKIQCRADLLLDENNIAHLAAAGCDEIWIGAESGSQKILDAMDKGTTVEQIYRSTELMKKHGIKPCFFLQFGYLGETKEDITRTLNMVRDCSPYDIGISVSYPLPGTKFHETVKSQLSSKQNWNDSDELLLMYKGTYSSGYYKNLHRYVHKRFRAMQGWLYLKGKVIKNAAYWKIPNKRIIALPYFALAALYYRLIITVTK